MGTLLRVETESGVRRRSGRDLIFAEIQRLELLLSRFLPGSEISSINRAAGEEPVSVGPETYDAIERSLDFARASSGAFSPVAGAGYRDVRLEPDARTVFLPLHGSSLDLGGIGKGFALDRGLELARQSPDLDRVHVDFGGQLLFWTRDGRPDPLTVAIEDPARPGTFLSDFEIRSNCSVSTSSQAERPGHLVDRRTGRTATGTASATIVAPSATEAEAWSTALFVAGGGGRPALAREPARRASLPLSRLTAEPRLLSEARSGRLRGDRAGRREAGGAPRRRGTPRAAPASRGAHRSRWAGKSRRGASGPRRPADITAESRIIFFMESL